MIADRIFYVLFHWDKDREIMKKKEKDFGKKVENS